ncbi:transmembrane emp24 domain-containing protein p24delta9 [Phtheirospermum japonicum]|uniref:Transmembrane emp24 domain-containing protein p24delta9 n=1 Tax=Phtheirospermum japonicum TaxID=374723 RepID=A0A830CW99_9LAMI|nr:transmembrane emp24 domain-containing protein p24delta9 [Phtheirospermum japonicum]
MNIRIQRQCLSLVLISVLVLLWTRVESIRFDLESGHTKCISEDIKSNSMTVGKYHIVNPNDEHPLPESHKVTVRVTSSYGNSYHYSDHVTEGNFAFQATEAGDYMACFFAADHKPALSITVDFDWKSGVAAKDWTNVAKKGSVELMELELKKMFDTRRGDAGTEQIDQLQNVLVQFPIDSRLPVRGRDAAMASQVLL